MSMRQLLFKLILLSLSQSNIKDFQKNVPTNSRLPRRLQSPENIYLGRFAAAEKLVKGKTSIKFTLFYIGSPGKEKFDPKTTIKFS